MNDPQHTLTPEIQSMICGYIRAGAFPQIAAEAAGIPQKVFDRWMRFGQAARPVPLYRDFVLAVRQAQAQARLLAEHRAMEDAPLIWLKSGPGKETTRMPGWTSPVRPPTPVKRNAGLSAQRTQELIACLLTALTPFPEARLAVAQSLIDGGWALDSGPDGQEPAAAPDPPPAVPPQLTQEVVEVDPQVQPNTTLNSPAPAPVIEEHFGASAQQFPTRDEEKATAPSAQSEDNQGQSVVQPQRIEATAKPQRTDKETTSNTIAGPERQQQTRPKAWDSLDAAHWIVFSSS